MTTEVVTLIAAIIAALTSIGSLLLNTRLAIRKEQANVGLGKCFGAGEQSHSVRSEW